MSVDTATYLDVLKSSSLRLRDIVATMSDEDLAATQGVGTWTIGDTLSHLGSAAEICTDIVERGIASDTTGPQRELLVPIWDRWNGLGAAEQRDAWLVADARHLDLLASVTSGDDSEVRVPYFSGMLDLATYMGYRLSEQSVHAWDIDETVNPGARIPSPEVVLLWDRIDLIASRFRDATVLAALAPAEIEVTLIDTDQTFTFELGDEVHITSEPPTNSTGSISANSDSLLRLIYGRSRDADTIAVSGPIDIADLRNLFPGY